jgi:hypothetical protein
MTQTDIYRSSFMKVNQKKVKLDYLSALKTIKVEALGIVLTMVLSFIVWPAIIFSNNVTQIDEIHLTVLSH